jgi:hypothetical protein
VRDRDAEIPQLQLGQAAVAVQVGTDVVPGLFGEPDTPDVLAVGPYRERSAGAVAADR